MNCSLQHIQPDVFNVVRMRANPSTQMHIVLRLGNYTVPICREQTVVAALLNFTSKRAQSYALHF